MRTLGCNELKELIDSPENEIILEVLDQSEFEKSHLPDAISVPYDDDFDARVLEAVPDKSLTVVVYCQNRHSRKSPNAAARMDELGYENVLHYADGKDDWRAADLPLIEQPR